GSRLLPHRVSERFAPGRLRRAAVASGCGRGRGGTLLRCVVSRRTGTHRSVFAAGIRRSTRRPRADRGGSDTATAHGADSPDLGAYSAPAAADTDAGSA